MIGNILDMESTNMVAATSSEESSVQDRKAGMIDFTEDVFDNIDDLFDLPDEDTKSHNGSSKLMAENSNISIYENNHPSLHSTVHGLAEPQCFPKLAAPEPMVEKGPEPPSFPEFGVGIEGNKLAGEDISNDFKTSSTISISESNSCSSKIPSFLDMIVPRKSRSKGSRIPVKNFASRTLSCDSYATVSEDCLNSVHVGNVPVYCNLDYTVLQAAKSQPLRHIYRISHAMKRKLKSERQCKQCTHCGISKTPQWRAGPLGPKTLCNACGVRYSSGRLLPEYRPAASPTFSADKHSNSHRKVLEMRYEKGFGDTGDNEA